MYFAHSIGIYQVECLFLDEIVDVFVGHPESSRKGELNLQRIFADHFAGGASIASSSCEFSQCIVTVVMGNYECTKSINHRYLFPRKMYGSDFVSPAPFVFLTKSPETSRLWSRELRKYLLKHHRMLHDAYFHWRKIFARLRCSLPVDEPLTVEHVLDALMGGKQREERKLLEGRIQRCLPILKDKVSRSLIADRVDLFCCHLE